MSGRTVGSGRAAEILAINEALDRLAELDLRQVHVVEMRFFGGLSVEEIAEVLTISPQSVMRDWKLAKAWLHREMRKSLWNLDERPFAQICAKMDV